MSTDVDEQSDEADDASAAAPDDETVPETTEASERADLAAAELEVLREENERLRAQFRQARQTTYRRATLGFVLVGLGALGAAALFPSVRPVLITLGATGLFAAILTYFVTPEEFHAATVSEQIYAATSRNGQLLAEELGLHDHRVYVPVGEQSVRLYVPAHRQFTVPTADALQSLFVVTGNERERGVALHPTGGALYDEFERITTGTDDLQQFTAQLSDAVVEQFELARSVDATAVPEDAEARFDVSGSSCGAVGGFDQPIVSFLATGLALHTGEPVRVEYPDDDADGIVRCVWADRE